MENKLNLIFEKLVKKLDNFEYKDGKYVLIEENSPEEILWLFGYNKLWQGFCLGVISFWDLPINVEIPEIEEVMNGN